MAETYTDDQVNFKSNDQTGVISGKQLKTLLNILAGIGSSSSTDMLAELVKISNNTADIEITADSINLNTDTVEANQATMITALQLIDDLQGALKSVDTDELVSRITNSSGTEIDPATSGNQDTQLTRAHGGTGASAVEAVTDAVAHNFTFHGIQVIEAVTLTALTDTNLSGNSLATATLQPGYHPIAGTSITKAAGGLMYLIGA